MAASQDAQNRAENQAKAQYESICEMVEALDTKNDSQRDDAMQAIQEDALDVQVRSDWHSPSSLTSTPPSEYFILLCTGGPAVRITGYLDEHMQPYTAEIEYQDWFTSWETFPCSKAPLLTYVMQFHFGE